MELLANIWYARISSTMYKSILASVLAASITLPLTAVALQSPGGTSYDTTALLEPFDAFHYRYWDNLVSEIFDNAGYLM